MKRLDEVEPRANLQGTPAPPGVDTSNASYHFIINQPGSYYLSANLGVTKANGIQIAAEGVTLDLNGFQISRTSGSFGGAIQLLGTAHRATIRNGSIKGFFATGISSPGTVRSCTYRDLAVTGCTSVGISAGVGAVIDSCRAHDNTILGGAAIYGGTGSTIRNCSAFDNNALLGIAADVGSTVVDCVAYGNSGVNFGSYGISVGAGSTLKNCSAYGNSSSNSLSGGIRAGAGSTVAHCTAYENTSTSDTVSFNTGTGFDVGSGSTIENCTATRNQGDGIRIVDETAAHRNTSTLNGTQFFGQGAGIHATGTKNRIEENLLTGCTRGVDVDGAGNTVRNNTVHGNEDNYAIVGGNQVEILLSALPETIEVPALVKLAGTLTGITSQNGITIAADNVTIDLQGHALLGVAGSLDGIAVSGARGNVAVRNGTVSNWGGDGVDLGNAIPAVVADLQVNNCAGRGVAGGSRATISKVTSSGNTGAGIVTGTISRVTDSTVFGNGADGILLGETSVAERCLANFGSGDGIVATNNCVLRENTCDFVNGAGKTGIRAGARNRIEANHLSRSTTGLIVSGGNNLIIRNSFTTNATSYVVAAGNAFGSVVTGATINGNHEPHANYEY